MNSNTNSANASVIGVDWSYQPTDSTSWFTHEWNKSANLQGTVIISSVTEEDKKKNMQTLYNVIVVNDKGEILIDEKVVAKTPDKAKYIAKANSYDPDEVTVFVNMLGQVKIKEFEEIKASN